MPTTPAKRPHSLPPCWRSKALAPSPRRAYRSALKAFLESGHQVTVDGFAAYIHKLRQRRSAAMVNQALAAGRKAFAQAGERLGLPVRELAVIKGALGAIPRVKKAPPEVAVITEEERARLLEALPLRVRLIAETLYGLCHRRPRVSEVLTVRRDHVKENGTVELRLYGKGGKERSSRIPAELYRRILAEFPEGIYLFESQSGQHFKREYISREIARAARRVLGSPSRRTS